MTTTEDRPASVVPTVADQPRPARIRGLDGLRGLAATFVVLHHVYLLAYPGYPRSTGPAWFGWLIYGHFAVAVFIVLSGFSLAVAPARKGWRVTDVGRFFRRRAWRILPTYWPALIFSLVVAWTITPQPGEGVPGLRSVAVNGLLVQDVFGAATPNGAFWSIPIEAQLYFVFPLLVLVARRLGAPVMTVLATAVVLVEGFAAPHVHVAHQLLRLTPQFAALFAMGVAAAGILRSPRYQRGVTLAAGVAFVPVVVLIAAAGSTWTLTHLFYVDLALAPAIALFVAAVASGAARRSVTVLDSRPLRSLGSFSYSLYLVHAPVVVATYHLFVADAFGHGTDAFLVALAIGLPASLLVARGFAALFEFPFTRTGSWPASRPRGRSG